jgi:carboxymethylenebutenolidase
MPSPPRFTATLSILAALLLAPMAGAAGSLQAQAIKRETVTIEVDGEKVQAYLAEPAGVAFYPGVVVIHEWWGLNGQIKGVADRLAGLGYLAIAPDLYRGKVASETDLAHELMRGLNEDRAVGIIAGAASYLRTLGKTSGRPVGLVGFCMGGRLSLATALKKGGVQAAVMYYGSVETKKTALMPLNAPLLGLFGAEDRGIPVDDVRKFEAALKEAGKTAKIVVYPGVGHGFFNEERPSYDQEAARDAWAQTREFFAGHLKVKSPPRRHRETGQNPAGR